MILLRVVALALGLGAWLSGWSLWRGSGGSEPMWADPFFACGILAAAAGGWLLCARGARWWRLPAAVASMGALPLWTGLFLLDVVPRVPVWDSVRWSVALPLCAHVLPEADWPEPGREPRPLVLERHGELEFGEARTLREIEGALGGLDDARFRLHARGETPWGQVEWVLAALPADLRHVWVGACAPRGDGLDPEEWRRGGYAAGRVAVPLERTDSKDALTVDVVGMREVQASYRGERVFRPTAVRFCFGDETTDDPRVLVRWLREAAGGRPFTGRVRANRRAPFGYVMAAVSALLEAGMDRWVTGELPPAPPEILDAEALPYPR